MRTAAIAALCSASCLLPATPGLAQAPSPHPSSTPQTNIGGTGALDVPDSVPTGSTVTVSGSTADPGTVRVLFRKRGQSRFSVRRTLTPDGDGRFSTRYVADDDYRLYAETDRSRSPLELVVARPVVEAPATVRPGSAVPVTVRAAAGTVVSLSFRRQGQSTFSVRRTGTTDSGGRFRTTFRADADHRSYAEERDGQRSDAVLTQLRTPRSLGVSNDPAFPGQVIALDAPSVFLAASQVSIVMTGPDGRSKEVGRVRARPDGSLSTEVMVPTDTTPGMATLQARAGDRRADGALYVTSSRP